MSGTGFLDLLAGQSEWGLSTEDRERLDAFRRLVLEENEVQNLTRLTSDFDFVFGHIADAVALLRAFPLEYPAMDLGSGAGIPGIPAAILGGGRWVLSDSELSKLEFLGRTVTSLGLSERVVAIPGRAEDVLRNRKGAIPTVVSRAVGPVSRIYEWIRPCSTWNTLILLKGPGWDREWDEFSRGRRKKELRWAGTHEYSVPDAEGATRLRRVVKLVRG